MGLVSINELDDGLRKKVDDSASHKNDTNNPHNVTTKQVNQITGMSPNALSTEYPEGFSVFYMTSGDTVNHPLWSDLSNSLLGRTGTGYMLVVETVKSSSKGASQTLTIVSNYTNSSGQSLGTFKRGISAYGSSTDWSSWKQVMMNGDVDAYNIYKSGKDGKKTFTVVEYKRADGTLWKKSMLSNANAAGLYQTQTINFYGTNGTTLERTETWSITYDADGDVVSEVKL